MKQELRDLWDEFYSIWSKNKEENPTVERHLDEFIVWLLTGRIW